MTRQRSSTPVELESSIVYGPVRSRRFGWDLGINLLPRDHKLCCFDCVYCQYGFNSRIVNRRFQFPASGEILQAWKKKMERCAKDSLLINHTTLSGNGEPTMHPRFPQIVHDLVTWRDRFRPDMKLALLTTGYRAGNSAIRAAMDLLDEPILKFDCAIPHKWAAINRPLVPLSFQEFKQNLCKIRKLTIQTMFLQGWNDGKEDIQAWRQAIEEIEPVAVQIYTISRTPALAGLKPVEQTFLQNVAKQCSSSRVRIEAFL